jgi:hypothetical protein
MNGIVDCVRPSTLPPVNAKHRIYHNGGTQSLGGLCSAGDLSDREYPITRDLTGSIQDADDKIFQLWGVYLLATGA